MREAARGARRAILLLAIGAWTAGARETAWGGNALQFDGVDDLVTVPDHASLDLGGDFTLEAWLQLPPVQDFPMYSSAIVVKSPDQLDAHMNYYLALRNETNTAMMIIGDGGTSQFLIGNEPLPSGVWVHVAAVRSADSLALYVNGERDTSVARTVDQAVNGAAVRLGGLPSPLGYRLFCSGVLDEVRIWNVARSGDAIRTGYACELPPSDPGLAAYWKLDAAAGQVVTDASPHANHGTRGAGGGAGADDPLIVASSVPASPCEAGVLDLPGGDMGGHGDISMGTSPNPTSGVVSVSFSLASPARARLDVIDAAGRHIRTLCDRHAPPGRHSIAWDGRDDEGRKVAAGTYVAVLHAAGSVTARKILVVP